MQEHFSSQPTVVNGPPVRAPPQQKEVPLHNSQRSYPPLPSNALEATPRTKTRKAVTKQPYRQPLTETDVAKVDIHGNPRGDTYFFGANPLLLALFQWQICPNLSVLLQKHLDFLRELLLSKVAFESPPNKLRE